MLRGLIERLDLCNVTIVVQDWGGPYGLVNATEMPERFARPVILNTWLHHEGLVHAGHPRLERQKVDFLENWRQAWRVTALIPRTYSAPDTKRRSIGPKRR